MVDSGSFSATPRKGAPLEWVGGRRLAPFYVDDGKQPYRASLSLWVEVPSELIVGHDLTAGGEEEHAVVRTLQAALAHPMAGPPRRPDRLRVGDEATAMAVRAVVGASIPVIVAPTPEIDALVEALAHAAPDRPVPGQLDASYLSEGRVRPVSVERMFQSAKLLYGCAPWKVATDDQVLRVDIPALDVRGACISIIGYLGESLGLMVFPSLDSYERFAQAAEALQGRGGPFDVGTEWLVLSYQRRADLSETQRREVAEHAWPVASAGAYPTVTRRDRDGVPQPLVERDVQIASAVASSLTPFFVKHRSAFEHVHFDPISESYFDEDDLEVRFTVPYDAFELFEKTPPAVPEPAAAKPGRNDPCHCGSGRKYKRCHLALDASEAAGSHGARDLRELDTYLVDRLFAFAMRRFGHAWRGSDTLFPDARRENAQLAVPWDLYHRRIDGATVLEWYLRENGAHLTREEQAMLAAQRAAWVSVWEVLAVQPGKQIQLLDLLSGEQRTVEEATASQTLVVRDTIVGRVVDHQGVSWLAGLHPRLLPPREAAEVVRAARKRLRLKGPVPPERLREESCARALISSWLAAVREFDELAAIPPQLENTDGDPLLLTTDHFAIAAGRQDAVAALLQAMPGVEPPEPGEAPEYVFLRAGNTRHKQWQSTVVGRAWFSKRELLVETNSTKRANALRAQLEAACGDRIRYQLREQSDPLSKKAKKSARAPHGFASEPLEPEEGEATREFLKQHYRGWLDSAIPALGGLTPREAVRTKGGREAVDLLLKDLENHDMRRPGRGAGMVPWLRQQLGLEE